MLDASYFILLSPYKSEEEGILPCFTSEWTEIHIGCFVYPHPSTSVKASIWIPVLWFFFTSWTEFPWLAKQLVSGIILLHLLGIIQMFGFRGISEWRI